MCYAEDRIRFARMWVENEKENKKLSVEQFYGDGLKNFMGRHLKVGTNPWSHSVQATPIPDNIGMLLSLSISFTYIIWQLLKELSTTIKYGDHFFQQRLDSSIQTIGDMRSRFFLSWQGC